MADDDDLKHEVARLRAWVVELREIEKIKNEIDLNRQAIRNAENNRWNILKDVATAAVRQVNFMQNVKHDHSGDSDRGLPAWLSVLITAAVTFVPVSALTDSFVRAVAGSGKRREAALRLAKLQKIPKRKQRAGKQTKEKLSIEIAEIDARIIEYSNNYSPELANFLQDLRDDIAIAIGTFFFVNKSNDKVKSSSKSAGGSDKQLTAYERTSAPTVNMSQSINSWIYSSWEEADAKDIELQKEVNSLFGTATALNPTPPKDNLPKKQRIKESEDYIQEITRKKNAKDILVEIRNSLEIDSRIEEPEIAQLQDLQLALEILIWCTTYDFSPKVIYNPQGEDYVRYSTKPMSKGQDFSRHPPALPGNLWDQIEDRYVEILHTISKYRVRLLALENKRIILSEYFSELHSKLKDETEQLLNRFSKLKVPRRPRP